MKQKVIVSIEDIPASLNPWLILHSLSGVAYLLSSMDYDCKIRPERNSGEKNLQGLDIKK